MLLLGSYSQSLKIQCGTLIYDIDNYKSLYSQSNSLTQFQPDNIDTA